MFLAPTGAHTMSHSDDVLLYIYLIYPRPLVQIFTQPIDALDAIRVIRVRGGSDGIHKTLFFFSKPEMAFVYCFLLAGSNELCKCGH